MTSTHKELCPEIVVSCPNECGITNMARKYLLEHRGGCPLEKVVCGFPGCEIQLRRDELKRHDEDYQLQHLQLLKTAFKTILQNQKDIIRLLQDCNRKLGGHMVWHTVSVLLLGLLLLIASKGKQEKGK